METNKLRFNLKERDYDVIQAAIRLGDWIVRQPGVTEEQRAAVVRLQEVLRGLPELPTLDGLRELSYSVFMDFGKVEILDSFGKAEIPELTRMWSVSLFIADKKAPHLEIFCHWTQPNRSEPHLECEHEMSFSLRPGDPAPEYDFNYDLWTQEVETLDRFKAECCALEIAAEAMLKK